MTSDPGTARRISRRWPVTSGITAVAVAIALGAIILLRDHDLPLGIDEEWMEELLQLRSPFWDAPAMFMDRLGGGLIGVLIVPLGVILILILFRRRWAALYFAVASAASALLVQIIKNVIDRPRPEQILVTADFGSFPSGHVANAATVAVALALLFSRAWIWIVGVVYAILMMLSRTYLGAHWLSDTFGGLLLGAGVAVIVWAPFAHRLQREDAHPHTVVWQPPRA